MSVNTGNSDQRYTLLLTSGGAVVKKSYKRSVLGEATPPLVYLPYLSLPRTSATWVDHSVDAAGHLLRIEHETPAFAVHVASLPGGAEETGDGTPEHPFVNLNSFSQRYSPCLIHALHCAGITLSVSVTGTVDYHFNLAGGSSGDSVVYDFSQAEVGGSALVSTPDPGHAVVRGMQAHYSVLVTSHYHANRFPVSRELWNAVFNNCSWGGAPMTPQPIDYSGPSNMGRAYRCAFDRCSFSAGEEWRSFFNEMDGVTVAGGEFRTSNAPAFYRADGCVFSGVSVVCNGDTLYDFINGVWGYGAIVRAWSSIFEACSVLHTYHIDSQHLIHSPSPDGYGVTDFRGAAVTSCIGCTFDRCSATVAIESGVSWGGLCLQACGFHNNSGSVFRECSGNSLREGDCPTSGEYYDSGYFHPMPCEP